MRPFSIVPGAMAAVWLVPTLQTGGLIFWIVGFFAGLTFLLWLLREIRPLERFVRLASPAVGLLGWGVLATFTGGLKSPLLAAFFFEIALAAVTMGQRGVVWVATCAAAVLGLIHFLYSFSQGWPLLGLELGFVVAVATLGVAVTRRRQASEQALRTQGDELGQRLESLQRALEDERTISRVGENVARLAHGLKNAVHSLRGFLALIEPRLEGEAGSRAALAGLRAAIDDLEKLARLTLAEGRETPERPPAHRSEAAAGVVAVVEEARRELSAASPKVAWTTRLDPGTEALVVGLGEATLLELLVILMRNAVEAMDGEGEGVVEVQREGPRVRIRIVDHGPGFAPGDLERIFTPGFTTKQQGSGFGLFLARRIVEENGGSLAIESGAERGAVVRVELPLVEAELPLVEAEQPLGGAEPPRTGGEPSLPAAETSRDPAPTGD